MVVKAKMGRRRYIVFHILEGNDITRKDLIFTFNRSLPLYPPGFTDKVDRAGFDNESSGIKIEPGLNHSLKPEEYPILKHRLKYFDGSHGILLCPHWLKPRAVEIINSIQQVGYLKKPVKIESLGISGTLKKARKKYLP